MMFALEKRNFTTTRVVLSLGALVARNLESRLIYFLRSRSVAAKWFFPEPDRAAAVQLRKRYESGEISLIAPDLLLTEFASLLAKRTRRKQISAREAQEAFQVMMSFAPRLIDTPFTLIRALDISLEHHMSLWDSVYVAVAVEYGCPFLATERRLFRTGKGRHPCLQLIM